MRRRKKRKMRLNFFQKAIWGEEEERRGETREKRREGEGSEGRESWFLKHSDSDKEHGSQ